jgi:hypothetical protein
VSLNVRDSPSNTVSSVTSGSFSSTFVLDSFLTRESAAVFIVFIRLDGLLLVVVVVEIMVEDARFVGAEKRLSIILSRNPNALFDSHASRILSLVNRFVAFASFVCVVNFTNSFKNECTAQAVLCVSKKTRVKNQESLKESVV